MAKRAARKTANEIEMHRGREREMAAANGGPVERVVSDRERAAIANAKAVADKYIDRNGKPVKNAKR